MRKIVLGIVVGILIVVGAYYGRRVVQNYISSQRIVSPVGKIFEKPLEKYSILRLSGRTFTPREIVLDEAVATTSAYTKYVFHFMSDSKKVTGVAHVPDGTGPFPVIVQLRGYVDREKYFPGEGTGRSAQVYAENGFISLAPDFLGYGGSDMPSKDIFEERFETYTTALNLLASVRTLTTADSDRIGVWGHSNGGQIALTVLEILGQTNLPAGRQVPATLWAPVSKPFPYSILYYTDDADDHGKLLRKRLAEFENEYDVELYSLTNYLDRITGPVQLHQGAQDESVPKSWSDELVKKIPDINYFIYLSADHNMMPDWNTVVSRDLIFFGKYLR